MADQEMNRSIAFEAKVMSEVNPLDDFTLLLEEKLKELHIGPDGRIQGARGYTNSRVRDATASIRFQQKLVILGTDGPTLVVYDLKNL